MSHDLVRVMHALFLPGFEACRQGAWCPAADVYRTRAGWIVKFELAGVRAEDIDLEAHGNRLTVRGTRRGAVQGPCNYYRLEIAYGEFERTVELPADLGRADVTTEYREGMLLVRVNPTREEERS